MISFFLQLQALAAIILVPFLKLIYRFDITKIKKATITLGITGFVMVPILLVVCYFILNSIYALNLGIHYFIMAFIFILPIYIYLPIVYHFYKTKKEKQVLFINLFNIVLNTILNLLFIQHLGIYGALVASTIAHFVVLIIYLYLFHKEEKNKSEYAVS